MSVVSGPDHSRSTAPRTASADALRARLDDPRTAAALHDLLDNAELLAMVATMADEWIRRSDAILGNVSDALAEAVGAAGGSDALRETAAGLAAALPEVRAAIPALQTLTSSTLLAPQTLAALELLSGALTEGVAEARATPAERTGLRATIAQIRDPETSRGLHVLFAVARALGRRAGA